MTCIVTFSANARRYVGFSCKNSSFWLSASVKIQHHHNLPLLQAWFSHVSINSVRTFNGQQEMQDTQCLPITILFSLDVLHDLPGWKRLTVHLGRGVRCKCSNKNLAQTYCCCDASELILMAIFGVCSLAGGGKWVGLFTLSKRLKRISKCK